MDKKNIVTFFDRAAIQWDAEMIRSDVIIAKILDGAGVATGSAVLDVACGTGVLFPDYLARQVGSVTAVDISPEMVKIAATKYPDAPITVLCADVEELPMEQKFDCIMIYNAFPHFPDPDRLIRVLAGQLNAGGTLTVAHGMSRAAIDARHQGAAQKVSQGLMHEDDLVAIFEKYLKVTVKISDDQMYQVTGRK